MTISVLTFAIILDIILANLKVIEDKQYKFNMVIKSHNCILRKCFYLYKKY